MTTPPPGFDPQNPYPQGQPYPPQGQPYPQGGQYPPPQYPPQYPAAPPPKKKKRIWRWALGAVVVLIAIGSILPDSKTKETSSGPASAPSASVPSPERAKDDAAPVGTKVRDGKFEFSVESVKSGGAVVGDNPFFQKKAQGEWVVVTVTVTNISDAPQSFTPSAQKLIDAQGRKFEPDSTAQIALGGSDVPVWDNINPGNTADVKLVYDMPADAVPAVLELHDSMFSGGAKVEVAP